MTQALNRLISVTGESTVTEHVDTRFPYDRWGGSFSAVGYWNTFTDNRFTRAAPVDSAAVAAILDGNDAGITVFTHYYLGGDRVSGVELPFPTKLENEVPLTIRIHGPTDDDYIEGVVTDVNERTNYLSQLVGWHLNIEDAVTQHGAVFAIGQDLILSFVGRGGAQPVSEATKDVWARLSERGADVGLVVGDFVRGEGAQERISATIRYDAALAIVKEFTDDLGRRWFATSTRTEGNRRYLVTEGQRILSGIDLPEYGADE